MLKLKMWPQYWPSLFCRSYLITLFLFCSVDVDAKSSRSKQPGVIESLELLLSLHKKQFKLLSSKVRRNPKVLSNLSNLKELGLHPFFMRSILFYSENKYLELAGTNKCRFYSLIENDLLKTAEGRIKNVIVNFTTNEGKKESAILTKKDFINQVYKRTCPNQEETSVLFKDENFLSTLKKIKLSTPTNKTDCQTILKDWQKNPFTPYLCRIPEHIQLGTIARKKLKSTGNTAFSKRRLYVEKIRRSDFLVKEIPYFERSYLTNLCYGLSNSEKFCRPYISEDAWSKVISGELPNYFLEHKCESSLGQNKLSKNQLKACASRFKTAPKTCIGKQKSGLDYLLPSPNCNSISKALMVSQLETDYRDCPGFIDNEAMINTHRIINHLDSVKLSSSKESCVNEVNSTFAKLLFDFDYEKGWPLKLCYMDKIEDKERCDPYIPGNNHDDKLSESSVISNILHKTKGLPSNLKCNVISKRKFNPNLLEFKSGCFVVYDQSKCTAQYCPKNILYNLKPVEDIEYVGKQVFDYFPTSFRKANFSLANILKETYKLKELKIRNFTDLIYFLDRKSKNIVHGIGCAEDLAPSFFQKTTLNQCTPLPFIIDGYQKDGSQVEMVTRLAIDNIHSPRLIPWNFIFNSIASYKTLHPLDTWTLYGLQEKNGGKN